MTDTFDTAPPNPQTSHINFLDRLFGLALSQTRFYRKGWGSKNVIERVTNAFEHVHDDIPIKICWLGQPQHTKHYTRLTGYFASPLRLLALPMPVEAQTAYFELVLPAGYDLNTLNDIPLCLHIAATMDQGFASRRRFAIPLLKQGIGALILENPYYGWRSPTTQRFVAIETLADQMMMNLATVLESHALLHWFRKAGFNHLGVTGYSMGGYMSGYIACTSSMPLATIARAVGISAEHVFTDYVLKRIMDWDALVKDAGDMNTAQQWMRQFMGAVSFREFAAPIDPDITIVLGAKDDAVVPAHETQALADHWKVPVRWVDGGHISAVFRGQKATYDAILDAFAIMMHKYPS